MQNKDDLIRENIELNARLALAEKWMRREVQSAITSVKRAGVRRETRKHFENTFEEDGIEIITQRIIWVFGDTLTTAPKYTLERLIDAEIYWETLQRYPHMDALPIVLAYQKILDAWIEEKMIGWFRSSIPYPESNRESSKLEKDIENILIKNYTLSLGRLYQIIEMIRRDENAGPFFSALTDYWKTYTPDTLRVLLSDDFFLPLSHLMQDEIFSKKRHEKKVSFRNAQKTREIIIGSSKVPSLFLMIFSS